MRSEEVKSLALYQMAVNDIIRWLRNISGSRIDDQRYFEGACHLIADDIEQEFTFKPNKQ